MPSFKKRLAGMMAAAALFYVCPAYAAGTGYIFVSNEKTNNIHVLDPKDYSTIKVIDTSRRPRDMRLNADRTLLYVACGNDDVIDVIDVTKLTV